MNLEEPSKSPVSNDLEQISELLPIQGGEKLIELGCGRVETTRALAERFPNLQIMATEVDRIQLDKNIQANDLPNVTFQFGGAERIDVADASVNYVIMLKSLHHVPTELMKPSLEEISRVLVPGGLAYFSEPVYAGKFNDILRLFNDEKVVRATAQSAIQEAVSTGTFELINQVFFKAARRFQGFAEFEQRIIGVTHSDFRVDGKLRLKVKAAFESHCDSTGIAVFESPMRVDLLRRSGAS